MSYPEHLDAVKQGAQRTRESKNFLWLALLIGAIALYFAPLLTIAGIIAYFWFLGRKK